MVDFFGQTLVYNLNRLITQRGSGSGSGGETAGAVPPVTRSCLRPSDRMITRETILPKTYEKIVPSAAASHPIGNLLAIVSSFTLCISRHSINANL